MSLKVALPFLYKPYHSGADDSMLRFGIPMPGSLLHKHQLQQHILLQTGHCLISVALLLQTAE